jgi:hypothetical protein
MEGARLRLVVRWHRIAQKPAAEGVVELALAGGRQFRRIEHVVGHRVQHAVGEQPRRQRNRASEQHLQAVADPDVAQRLPEVVEPK